MKKYIFILISFLAILACENEKPDLLIKGHIKGLKKGKLYLQTLTDSIIVNLDSVSFYNSNRFRFERKLDYPQVMYLQLKKDSIDPADNFIAFFADKGKVNVKAELGRFIFAEAEADYPNQKAFGDYSKNIKRFGDQKLDLIKAEMEARKSGDSEKLDSVNLAYNRMHKRRYLYTVNFAFSHPDLEVSPYIVMNQARYINKKYLDSVYQSFHKSIQKSYYGKQLNDLITQNP